MRQKWRVGVFLWAALILAAGLVALQPAPGREVEGWTLDTAESAARWIPNGDVNLEGIRDGGLAGQVVGADPILLGPPTRTPASPFQWIEVRFRSDQPGSLLLFWAMTTEEPYGGFRPNQVLAAPCEGDGAFHTFRFFPLWHGGQTLLRLRVDPPAGSQFALKSVQVLEEIPTMGSLFHVPAGQTSVDGESSLMVTDPAQPVKEPVWEIQAVEPFAAGARPWAAVEARSSTGGRVRFGWLSSETDGLSETGVNLEADGASHTYNISMASQSGWKGKITGLAVLREPGQRSNAGEITAAAEPVGPPDPLISRLVLWTVEARAGKEAPVATVVADVANLGGKPAKELAATLRTPAGLQLLTPEAQQVESLDPGDRQRLRWTVHADRPVRGVLQLTVRSMGKVMVRTTPVEIPAMKGRKSGIVPEPHPLSSNYEVGVYYFPGWWEYSRWQVLDEFPERTPVLGYYREGSQEVAEWQLKWMAEHGVRFVAYDWYWDRGGRSLEQGLEAYLKCRNRRFVKFCLLWATHNPPHSSSAADLEAVTRYWIANYFRRSECYTIDGKPVVIIFSPGRFTEDMGVAAVKEAFNRMREQCRAAGLPGIYLVACVSGGAAQLKDAAEEGYDAMSGYNYPGVNVPAGSSSAPYAAMIPGYQEIWRSAARGPLPYIPPTAPGWDNRPWAGDRALVRTGSTPELFGEMLRQARQFADEHSISTKDGPRKVVLVEAWNEFGEGDYVEPCRGYGFGMLDAIRAVFGAPASSGSHVDLAPPDVGMGPYELAPTVPVTSWSFDRANSSLGWAPQNMVDFAARVDGLHGTASNYDPAFIGPGMDARAAKYSWVEITMSVDAGADGQLFWAARSAPFSEEQSVHFATIPDGKPHTYVVNVGKIAAWTGHIIQLRIDPDTMAGGHARLLRVRLAS